MQEPFDRRAVRRHRDRAAATLTRHDFLLREAVGRLAERLSEGERHFSSALVLGAGGGLLRTAIAPFSDTVVEADLSLPMLSRQGVVASEELLPFAPAAFDLVVSALVLHWVNDLPGALVQIRRSLRPGGLFLGTMLGGETLRELRAALLTGEAEVRGGASPRVAPFADVRDAGSLLQRVGFERSVADFDTVRVTYADPLQLMTELRGMGETNALAERRRTFTPRATLAASAEAYRDQFADSDGRVRATFQLLTLTGWAAPPRTPPEAPAGEHPPAARVPRRLQQG